MVKLSGFLSAGLVGTRLRRRRRVRARRTSALRPDAACATRELFAAHSAALTPNCCGRRGDQHSFAAAPATRMP